MNRLRKSFRDSFRRKKDRVPESSKPHQWEDDEKSVRIGDCSFPVKYLGCLEVFDSRGMQVCEDALKVLRSSRRRPIKAVLHVTGDGLRVVDDERKGLLVDQTIEKVSFCAPDRFHERGFSYICRDGTTRRWMCHGFHASRDSGERLSHAVGCAFAVCLEKKQKRDREHSVTMQFDNKTSTFTRNGSFRQSTITERLKDPQIAKPALPPPVKPVHNPFAIERPRATPDLIQRQGSFRGFSALSQASPFKRQLSLRINDLPSNIERQKIQSSGTPDLFPVNHSPAAPVSPSVPNQGIEGPEFNTISPMRKSDTISEMCKELSKGLQMLTEAEPVFPQSQTEANRTRDGSHSFSTLASDQKDAMSSAAESTAGKEVVSIAVASPLLQKVVHSASPVLPVRPVNRYPNMSQLRSQSLNTSVAGSNVLYPANSNSHPNQSNGNPTQRTVVSTPAKHRLNTKAVSFDYNTVRTAPIDPFDTDWASIPSPTKDSSNGIRSTNPFAQSGSGIVKTFEVQM